MTILKVKCNVCNKVVNSEKGEKYGYHRESANPDSDYYNYHVCKECALSEMLYESAR